MSEVPLYLTCKKAHHPRTLPRRPWRKRLPSECPTTIDALCGEVILRREPLDACTLKHLSRILHTPEGYPAHEKPLSPLGPPQGPERPPP